VGLKEASGGTDVVEDRRRLHLPGMPRKAAHRERRPLRRAGSIDRGDVPVELREVLGDAIADGAALRPCERDVPDVESRATVIQVRLVPHLVGLDAPLRQRLHGRPDVADAVSGIPNREVAAQHEARAGLFGDRSQL
jgi:hypothetical protein